MIQPIFSLLACAGLFPEPCVFLLLGLLLSFGEAHLLVAS